MQAYRLGAIACALCLLAACAADSAGEASKGGSGAGVDATSSAGGDASFGGQDVPPLGDDDSSALGVDASGLDEVAGGGGLDTVPAGTPDAQSSSDLNVGGGDTPGVPEQLTGAVIVFEVDTDSAGTNRGNAGAAFGDPVNPEPPSVVLGGCGVFGQAAGTNPVAPKASADAGLIQVTGTVVPVDLTFGAGGPGVYGSSLADDNAEVFGKPGAPITVTGLGGADVAPFQGQLVTPEPVVIKQPGLGLASYISTGDALTIAWNADPQTTSTVVSLAPVGLDLQPVKGSRIECTLAGDPGTFTVPAQAMKRMPSSFGTRIILAVTRVQSTTVDADGTAVTLAVTTTRAGIASAK